MKKLLRGLVINRLWRGVQKKVSHEQPFIIALTGTVGKTSTKEATALVLEQSGRPVIKTAGSLNTEFGVPLSLLGFKANPNGILEWISALYFSYLPPLLPKSSHPYYVLEFSADRPGDIAFLSNKFSIQMGLLTAITPAHMLEYPSFEDLIREKFSLFSGLVPGGKAILNRDDPVQVAKKKEFPTALWYGIKDQVSEEIGVWAHHLKLTNQGYRFQLEAVQTRQFDGVGKRARQSIEVQARVIGKHQLYPLLAAAAVGVEEKVPLAKIQQALEAYRVPNGRGTLIEGQKEMTIVDDSYNASPEATKAGLLMLRELAQKRRVVAILGRMNEMGKMAEAAHKEVAAYAAGKVDFLVVVGQYEKIMKEAAEKAGLASNHILGFTTTEQLISKLDQCTERGDLVYVKGSQNGVRLEKAIKKMMAHPERAKDLLVRQGKFWSKR